MRQYAGFSSVNESNKRYLKLIESGVSGLSIAFLKTALPPSPPAMIFNNSCGVRLNFSPAKFII